MTPHEKKTGLVAEALVATRTSVRSFYTAYNRTTTKGTFPMKNYIDTIEEHISEAGLVTAALVATGILAFVAGSRSKDESEEPALPPGYFGR